MYLANFSEVDLVEYETDGTVTGMTMDVGKTFFEFEYEVDTAQKLEELQVGAVSRFVNQTLTFKLANLTQAKSKIVEELAIATLTGIIQTSDGLYWLFGDPNKSTGMRATVATVDSGTAKTDDSSITITLVGASLGYADEVDSSIIAALL